MKKTDTNLLICTVLFCVALVISNVVTGRVIEIPFGLTVAGGLIIYPLTFLITDVVGEIWGKREANRIVMFGFLAQIFATLLIVLTGLVPSVDPVADSAYKTLLGQNWIIVVGSLTAYLAAQTWDVHIFHKIRDKYIQKHGSTGGRWIWNNVSTMTSQIIDTVIFITIAFGFGFGWIWDNHTALINMMIGQYAVKFVLSLIDTPFFYLLTRGHKSEGISQRA